MTAWPAVSATGHRPQHLAPAAREWVRGEMGRIAAKLRDHHGMTVGISGMALGADMWWAACLVDAGVDLWAHVPFPQQADPWRPADRDEWNRLLRVAKKLTTYGGYYDVKTLHARNDGMLKASAAVVAVHDPAKTSGGTASAVRKATAAGLPIIHVDPAARTVTLRNAARADDPAVA